MNGPCYRTVTTFHEIVVISDPRNFTIFQMFSMGLKISRPVQVV